MKIGSTGTQVGMTIHQWGLVRSLLSTMNIEEFHHGDCIGADKEAHEIVVGLGCRDRIVIHPPINKSKRAFCIGGKVLPAKEYIQRNHDIVDATDVLIAVPKTLDEEIRSGTWATIRYAQKMNKPVSLIAPTGVLIKK